MAFLSHSSGQSLQLWGHHSLTYNPPPGQSTPGSSEPLLYHPGGCRGAGTSWQERGRPLPPPGQGPSREGGKKEKEKPERLPVVHFKVIFAEEGFMTCGTLDRHRCTFSAPRCLSRSGGALFAPQHLVLGKGLGVAVPPPAATHRRLLRG